MRLRQKVTQLEALLARSCERIRSNNILKHGMEYQMTAKVYSGIVEHKLAFFSFPKLAAFCHELGRTWAPQRPRPRVQPPWLEILNRVEAF